VAQNTFDVLGGILYITWCAIPDLEQATSLSHCGSSCLLEIGIFASHLIWLARTRKIRKAAAAEGKTFDDIAAEHEALGIPFTFAERKGRRRCGLGESEKGNGASEESAVAGA
jgi:hypothetical protein